MGKNVDIYSVNPAVLSANNTWSGTNTFANSTVVIWNPAGTFGYTIVSSAIVANRNLTLPLLTGNDTFAVLGLAQTFSQLRTFGAGVAFTGSSPSISTYNNIPTAGSGVPFIVAAAATGSVSSTQTNLINYTPPSAAGTYRLSGVIHNRSGTNTGNTVIALGYHGPDGNATSIVPIFQQSNSATWVTAATGSSSVFPFSWVFRVDNSGTAITATFTVSGTVATYISAVLEQLI